MVFSSHSIWQFCLLCLPLSSALTVPQKALAELSEDGIPELDQDYATDDAAFNISDYTSADDWNPAKFDYDVVIVGGGPAGLAASMSLARVARTTLLYDSQEYRNEQTRYMHDVLGQDGDYSDINKEKGP